MRLFFYGHEGLSWTQYKPVEIKKPEDLAFVRRVESWLVGVMRKYRRSGFTAPQLGIPIQMAVVRLESGRMMTMLNPQIERMYGAEVFYPETCISCPPGSNGCKVARMQTIEVIGRTIERGYSFEEWMDGFWVDEKWTFMGKDARIVQHELDHLSGTFFFERASLVDRDKVIENFHQWKFKFRKNGHAFAC